MLTTIRRSIRHKLMLVVIVTTFSALLLTGIALVVYDLRHYERTSVNDLITQADLVGQASAPALGFDDPVSAQQNLDLLRARPLIESAAIYTLDGQRFATFVREGVQDLAIPPRPGPEGHRIVGNNIRLFRRITDPEGAIGTVFLSARYELRERLETYLTIVGAVMIMSLLVATAVSYRMQAAVTQPILAIRDVARQVRTRRDYSRRVRRTTDDELGDLVDSFNEMLGEVGARSEALESANRKLQSEMTVRREAELALLAADQRKDEFLATLAHELRNPLAPIGNAVKLLRHPELPEADRKWAQEVIDRQVEHLTRLVDDLIDVSRITRNKLTLQRSRVALSEVIQGAIQSSRPAIDASGHTLTATLPPDAVFVDADVIRLSQVFMNLLNNAAKYTPPGGTITLDAVREGAEVVIRVRDSGIGIAPDKLPHLFDLFFQADQSLERARGGLGIGLSLVRQLVELHDGQVTVASDGLGHGSTFTVRLPLATGLASGPGFELNGSGPQAPAPSRILVVDDNLDAATSLARLLQLDGNEVHTAADGLEAVDAASRLHPNVILLDIGLPKLDGYGAARRIREQAWSKQALLIALTGWGQAEDRERSRAAGIDHHLVKPVNHAVLLDLLREARRDGGTG